MSRLKQVEEPWYGHGVHFECTGCGQCCAGTPGYVWVTVEEIEAIADHLQLSVEEFSAQYIRVVEGRFSLKENLPHYDCVFLKDKKCSIYDLRPTQCRTFPFWASILESEEAWIEASTRCEGIHRQAAWVSREEIESKAMSD